MSQAETARSRSEFPGAVTKVPAPVLFLHKTDQSPVPHTVGISNCGHRGTLSEAKGMALREGRLKVSRWDPGPSFLSVFSLNEFVRLFSSWT